MTGQTFDPGPPVDYAWAGEVLQRWVGAQTRGDVSAFVEVLADDAVLQADPFQAPLAGTNAIRAYLLQRGEEEADVDVTIERHWVSGATILAAWHASFVLRRDRSHVREAGFLTVDTRAGRCTRVRVWTVRPPGTQ